MDVPTAQDLRDWSPPDFPWTQFGFVAPTSGIDPLQKRVDWAQGYIEGTTWRPFSTVQPPDVGGNLPMIENTPIDLTSVAEQALMLAVLQQVMQQSKQYVSATVLQDYISSFTAGSYSEQRSGAENIIRSRGGSVENPLVNKWRELSDLLYLLMTPDAYAYWRYRLTGINPPAGGFIGQDWGMMPEARPAVWGPGMESWPVGGGY